MMISSFRRSLQNEEAGQAIILGVATMLVLAVGIMTTAQLGWAIKAKIQLQHAADNAAYSNATMVARSLNFIAWTNRAIVSQYVSAMAFQSMVTHLDGVNMLIAAAAASVLSAAFVLGVVGRILEAIIFTAAIGAAMIALAKILGKAGEAIEKVADKAQDIINGIDKVIAPIVEYIGKATVGLQEGVYFSILQQVFGKGYIYSNLFSSAVGGSSFYKQAMEGTAGEGVNGSDSHGVYDAVSSLLSGANYLALFDKKSEKVGKDRNSSDGDVVRAEALMTTIVNASREGRKSMTFESKREFGLSSVFVSLVQLVGGGNLEGLGRVMEIFDGFFAKSQGGTLISRQLDEAKAVGTSKENEAKINNNNPVFDKDVYHGINKPNLGQAIISEQYIRPPGGSIGGLIGRALNLLAVGGELIPMDKRVGIQATYNTSRTWHCRYGGLVAFEISGNALGQECDNVCGDSMKDCEDNCEKRCPGDRYVKDENGNPTSECEVPEEWQRKPGNTNADVDCGTCGSAEASSDGDECEAAKQCREALEQAMDQLENAANEAAGEVMEGFFGGRMAQVSVNCTPENRHKFDGIRPYVSFDIKRFDEKQRKHEPMYPTFLAATHRKPSFMKVGALGFGDNFGSSKKFKISSLGKVSGNKRIEEIYDVDGAENPNVDGYNFNYLNDSDSGVNFLSVPGFHAWASSEVYYHRPGTWAEPPNLFNPYWKPKLTPMVNTLDGLGSAIGGLDSLGDIGGLIGQVMTH